MKLHKIFFISLFFLAIWHSPIFAEPNPTPLKLSMKEAILLALRNNANIQSGELQRVLDKFNLAVAQYQFEFQYSLTGSSSNARTISSGIANNSRSYLITPAIQRQTVYGTQFQLGMPNAITSSTGSGGSNYNPALALVISQPLLQGSGRDVVEAPLKAAYNSEEIAKLTLKGTVIASVTQIISDYLAVVSAENALIIDKEALKSAEETVKQNVERIAAGFMAPADNVLAKLQVANQQLLVATDLNTIIQTKLTLVNDIGLPPETAIEVKKDINIKNVKYPTLEKAKCLVLQNNISYQQAVYAIKNSKLNLLLGEDKQRWTLNLTGSITQGPGGSSDTGTHSLFDGQNQNRVLGLTFAVPIGNLPNQQILAQAKVALSQAEVGIRQLKYTLESTIQSSYENLNILRQQIDIAIQAQNLAEQTYQNALKKLQFGQVSIFEVTTIQTNLINSQITVISNEISYLNAVASFQQSLGVTLDIWDINLRY